MVSLFVFNNIICYAIAGLFLIFVIVLSKVPVKFMMRGMHSVIFLMLFTALYNILLGNGTVIAEIGIFTITYEGIYMAFCMFLRLLFLVMGSSVLSLTTTPSRLTDGLESLLTPLKIFRVPVHEIAMMMSIALRFIPILMEEADRIMKAQRARGADFDNRNLFKRLQSFIPILVPLFLSSFRRADDLAMAMEARCYRGGEGRAGDLALAMEARCYHGGAGRTRMKEMKLTERDYVTLVVLIAYIGIIVFHGTILRDWTQELPVMIADRFMNMLH